MANKTWQNRGYGPLDEGGRERAIDYGGAEEFFAPVRAVILMTADEVVMGGADSPVFITGNISDAWEVVSVKDAVLGDNDKSLTVPANYEYELLSAYVTVVTNATVGNRNLALQAVDSDADTVAEVVVGSVQTASTTGHYQFGAGVADLTTFRDANYLMTPIPPALHLNETESFRFFDRNNVATGDSVWVRARVARRQKPYFSG